MLDYRQQHPTHGPIRIAQALRALFPQAHLGTIHIILQQAQLSQAPQLKRQRWTIPVGQHRVQMNG